jgi:hypothetical protein
MKRYNPLTKLSTLKTAVLIVPLLAIFIGMASLIVQPARAAAAPPGSPVFEDAAIAHCKKGFFGLVPWYEYMSGEFFSSSAPTSIRNDACSIKCFNLFTQTEANECGQTKSDVPAILLAIIDDLLRIAGIVAVAFTLVGAFQLVTSQGNAEQAANARSTITNALAGTAIAVTAIAFVSFLGNNLK